MGELKNGLSAYMIKKNILKIAVATAIYIILYMYIKKNDLIKKYKFYCTPIGRVVNLKCSSKKHPIVRPRKMRMSSDDRRTRSCTK